MRNKKGFTLIELLAVIVILAIIALIAVPVIINIISKASKSAFKDSGYGIIKAGELYYTEKLLDVDGMTEDVTFTFPEADGLNLKGSKPTSGTMIVNVDGEIKLAISNGRWCARKNYNESEVTLDDDIENCGLTSNPSEKLITSLEVSSESLSLMKDDTYKIEATITPDDASNKELKWTSLDESIATVDQNGNITGVKAGDTKVKVETQDGTNLKKEISVTVRQLVESLELDKTSVTIYTGESDTVTATVLPDNAYLKEVKWTSLNPEIATVEGGVITGVKAGSTTITVASSDGNATNTINVTVNPFTNGIMASEDKCIKEGTCTNGTKINVKVNNTENYDFYVIKDTGTELTLIMDRNLGSKVAWITKEDYIASGGTETDYGSYGNTNKGPLTAITALEERTAGWTNIPTYNYTYTDDGGGNKYSGITRNNIRARLLTNTEATGLGCVYESNNSCPTYLYENTSGSNTEEAPWGYWLSAAYSSYSYTGLRVYFLGNVNFSYVTNKSSAGVRPVIVVSKNQ